MVYATTLQSVPYGKGTNRCRENSYCTPISCLRRRSRHPQESKETRRELKQSRLRGERTGIESVNLPVSSVSGIHSIVKAVVVTCIHTSRVRKDQRACDSRLTSIVSLLAFVVFVILEGIHKQRTANQSSTTCSHALSAPFRSSATTSPGRTGKQRSSHPRTGFLGGSLLDDLRLRTVRPEPPWLHPSIRIWFHANSLRMCLPRFSCGGGP